MANWFVDAGVSSSGNGLSWSTAWKNIGDINTSSVNPGDTVYFSGGTSSKSYSGTNLSVKGGTLNDRITYKIGQEAPHKGEARFTLSGPIVNHEHVNIIGDAGDDIMHFRILTNHWFENHNYFRWSYLNFGTINMAAFMWQGETGGYGVEIDHCYFKKDYATWSFSGCDCIGILNTDKANGWDTTKIHHNYFSTAIFGHWGLGEDGFIGNMAGCSFYNNEFWSHIVSENSIYSQHCDYNQNLGGARKVKFHNNLFVDSGQYAIYFSTYYSVQDLWVYNNLSINYLAATMTGGSNRAFFVEALRYGPDYGIPSGPEYYTHDRVKVFNNTIVDYYGSVTGSGILMRSSAEPTKRYYVDCECKDNVAINVESPFGISSQIAQSNNISISSANAPNIVEQYSPYNSGNILVPKSTDSILRNQGNNHSFYFTTDYRGEPRDGNYDIGAFEYVSGLPPPTVYVVPATVTCNTELDSAGALGLVGGFFLQDITSSTTLSNVQLGGEDADKMAYIPVKCDGYVLRINTTEGDDSALLDIRDPTNTTWWISFTTYVYVGGTAYFPFSDGERGTVILENNPNRVVVRIEGNFEESGGDTELANSTKLSYTITAYPDRIFIQSTWVTSDTITLDTSATQTSTMSCFSASAALTNKDVYYENSGSESDAAIGAYPDAKYFVFVSDEINCQMIQLDYDYNLGTSSFTQVCTDENQRAVIGPQVGTILAGTHTSTVCFILDSANRDYGAQLYAAADRIIMGDQYKDLQIDLVSGGSKVFDDSNYDGLYYNSALLSSPPFTFAAWFKSDDNTTQDQTLVSITDTGAGLNNLYLLRALDDPDYTICPTTKSTTWYNENQTSTTWSTNTWHHACGVWTSATNRTAYLDGGGSSGTSATSCTPTGLDTTCVGYAKRATDINHVSGKVCHAAIWNIALSADEVARLANGALPNTIRPEAIVAYWPLVDDDNDYYGNYNLTEAGNPTFSTTDYPDVWQPTKGQYVNDLLIPAQIDESGFAADGAWHVNVDANDEAEIEWDRTRKRPAVVIHNFPLQYGDIFSPTTLQIEYMKCDDNEASSTVIATVGNNGNWETAEEVNRNTNNDSTTNDALQLYGLDTKGTYHIDHVITVYDAAYFQNGSKIVVFTPQFAHDVAAAQVIWSMYCDVDNFIQMYYSSTNDRFEMKVGWGGTDVTINGPVYTLNHPLQMPTVIQGSWSYTNGYIYLAINGEVVATAAHSGTAVGTGGIYAMTGADCVSDEDGTAQLTADIVIDENRALDTCVLPFGAFFIGNGSGLLEDIYEPHPHLSWYFDGQAANARGGKDLIDSKNPTNTGGSFTTTDNILGTNCWDSNGTGNVLTVVETSQDIVRYDKGMIAMWINVQTAPSGGEYLFDVRDADGSDRISAVWDGNGNLDVTYRSNSTDETIVGNIGIGDATGFWHWIKITWDDTDQVKCYIDGVENGVAIDIANAWGGGTGLTWYFTEDYNNANGCDVKIQNIYMGKSCSIPEIWSSFGIPLHVPKLQVS